MNYINTVRKKESYPIVSEKCIFIFLQQNYRDIRFFMICLDKIAEIKFCIENC